MYLEWDKELKGKEGFNKLVEDTFTDLAKKDSIAKVETNDQNLEKERPQETS